MDVTSSTAAVSPDTAVSMNVLASDVDGNKTVDRPDVSLIKGDVGMAVTGSNFREDVRVDGTIDNNDVKTGKGDIGHSPP